MSEKDKYVLRPPIKSIQTPMGRLTTMTRSDVLGSVLKAWPEQFEQYICLESEVNQQRSETKAAKVTTVKVGDEGTQTMATPPPSKTVNIEAKTEAPKETPKAAKPKQKRTRKASK